MDLDHKDLILLALEVVVAYTQLERYQYNLASMSRGVSDFSHYIEHYDRIFQYKDHNNGMICMLYQLDNRY